MAGFMQWIITVAVCLLSIQAANSGDAQSQSASHRQCGHVQVQFVQEKIGSATLVPDYPIHDSEMEICYKGSASPSTKSCCSRKMERKYHIAAEKDFYEVIRSTSSYLKNLLSSHGSKYQEEYLTLIEEAKNATELIMGEVYKIPARYRYAPLESFFMDLQAYVRHREVSIRESTTMFFDELFPLVFHYQLEDSTRTEMSEDYRECLMEIRQQLTPQPFGDFPHQLAHQLTRSLQFPRTFIESLNLGIETINTTDHVSLDTQCTRALTRLRYCGSCDNHVGARPCRNFCYNVMRGCLATVTEIDRHWNEYVDAVKALTQHHMRDIYDAESVLRDLSRRVSEAILHAMENGHKFYPKVIEKCGHQQPSKDKKHSDTVPKMDKPIQVTTSADLNDGKRRIHANIDTFMRSLLASKEFYANLADTMCSADTFATGFDQDKCWNGEGLGRYNKTLVDAKLDIQMKHNPEMRVGQSQQKTMIVLIDKLMHVKKLLSSKIAQDTLQADDWNTKHQGYQGYQSVGSGYGYNNYRSTQMDDEDYGYSGERYHDENGSGGGRRDGRHQKYHNEEGSGAGSYPYYNEGTRIKPERRPGQYGSDNSDIYYEEKPGEDQQSYGSKAPEEVKGNNLAPTIHLPLVTLVITTTMSLFLWLNG